ncbi:MAG TPA: hypothetical protein DD734_09465, partial [Firmicutes bacterium]|nr:hypothetical protein [Bacillota bacterium]
SVGKNISHTKYFTISANEAIKIQAYTGKYTREVVSWGVIFIPYPPYIIPIPYTEYIPEGFECSYTLDFKYDEA